MAGAVCVTGQAGGCHKVFGASLAVGDLELDAWLGVLTV